MWVVPDFETVSACDLKKAGSARYAEDPTTDIICLSLRHEPAGVTERWYPGDPIPPRTAAAMADPAVAFVAHNAGFEKDFWRKHMVPIWGWPALPNERWHCTQAMAAMRVIPQDLEMAVKVLRLPIPKDMEGNKLTLSLSKVNKKTAMFPPITPAIRERVGQYCDTDTESQAMLHRRLGWMPVEERKVWLQNQRVNERGVRLDMDLIAAMRDVVDRSIPVLEREFAEITGGLKFTQVAQIVKWCHGEGVHLDNLQKDTLVEVLGGEDENGLEADGEPMPAHVRRALEIRQLGGSSSIKKLGAMEACVCADGRARRLLQYHGTGPGRSAGRLLQPQNFPRGTNELLEMDVETKVSAIMSRDIDWIETVLGPPVESVVGSLRHVLIPDKGRVFVSGDFSGIQARTVLAVAGQHDKAALMAAGLDVYIDMAFNIFPELRFDLRDKALVKAFKQAHTSERTLGKNCVLGLGFQMGAPKFRNKYAKDAELEFVQRVVDAYRQEWAPKVPSVWRTLQDASLEAVKTGRPVGTEYGVEYRREDEWLTARLPSGRKLWYFNPQLVRREMPWSDPEVPDIRLAWTYNARKMGKWLTIDAFGGQVTENVVMGIERDLMSHAQFLLEENGFPVVLEVHDEIVAEPLERNADEKAFKQIMEDVPQWCRQLQIPVAIEGWTGDRYRK